MDLNHRPLGYEFHSWSALMHDASCESVAYAFLLIGYSCCFFLFHVSVGRRFGRTTSFMRRRSEQGASPRTRAEDAGAEGKQTFQSIDANISHTLKDAMPTLPWYGPFVVGPRSLPTLWGKRRST